ncbi:hypothetical protein KKI90_16660 [Xenorhabdus bovienii]|uniref:hypothetical protein n=1 Tax=Xenorhabdus bovienii TaxID=40576 RepID=UPI00237C7CE2|nr:hypothetical protein [Xenorhabdus bovienii]MDE1487939.1 hypothetical protein [Xenorhabdus bovienii]MDE1495979.1 hypothetical protein [Xenorhabdus bovienii]MDE9445113.1 hypothetical protein [Xenorhabdus bovienii]MDE9471689.1 hypothetical protein [Xenorhabdus bovienii]MDE9478849.1 hypothetical protein [Xenorhabdus bovienii]
MSDHNLAKKLTVQHSALFFFNGKTVLHDTGGDLTILDNKKVTVTDETCDSYGYPVKTLKYLPEMNHYASRNIVNTQITATPFR